MYISEIRLCWGLSALLQFYLSNKIDNKLEEEIRIIEEQFPIVYFKADWFCNTDKQICLYIC